MSQVSSVLNVDGVSTITSDEEGGPDNHEGPSSNDQDRLSNTSLASRPPSSIVLTSDIQSSDAVQQPTLNIQDADRPDGSANIRTLNSPQSPPSYWEPIWLRKVTLICSTTLFLLLGIGILVLYVVSSENEVLGPYTAGGDSVYMWRYIPTIGKFSSHNNPVLVAYCLPFSGSNAPSSLERHRLSCKIASTLVELAKWAIAWTSDPVSRSDITHSTFYSFQCHKNQSLGTNDHYHVPHLSKYYCKLQMTLSQSLGIRLTFSLENSLHWFIAG